MSDLDLFDLRDKKNQIKLFHVCLMRFVFNSKMRRQTVYLI